MFFHVVPLSPGWRVHWYSFYESLYFTTRFFVDMGNNWIFCYVTFGFHKATAASNIFNYYISINESVRGKLPMFYIPYNANQIKILILLKWFVNISPKVCLFFSIFIADIIHRCFCFRNRYRINRHPEELFLRYIEELSSLFYFLSQHLTNHQQA